MDNSAGEILEKCMWYENLICINDGNPTRRNSKSVTDLFLITPKLKKDVRLCSTLVQQNVRSDHIAVLLDLEDNLEQNKFEEEKFYLYTLSTTTSLIQNKTVLEKIETLPMPS